MNKSNPGTDSIQDLQSLPWAAVTSGDENGAADLIFDTLATA